MASPQKENGYTSIANELLDALCAFRIPGECRQVLDCIIRKTYGYNKTQDWIANSQIVEMTGMKKSNVSRALSKLITNKVVIQSDNILRLNKNYLEWISFKTLSKMITGKNNKVVIQSDTAVIQSDTAVIQSDNDLLSKVMDTKDNKDNITKDNITKDNAKYSHIEDLTDKDFQEISEHYQVPLAFVMSEYEDMTLWHAQNPKRNNKSNWRATLMNWVKRDAIKIRKEANGKSKIRIITPDPSWK